MTLCECKVGRDFELYMQVEAYIGQQLEIGAIITNTRSLAYQTICFEELASVCSLGMIALGGWQTRRQTACRSDALFGFGLSDREIS